MYKKLISFITSKYVLQNMNICQLHKQNKNKYCTSQFGCGASTVHILSGEYLAKRNNTLRRSFVKREYSDVLGLS